MFCNYCGKQLPDDAQLCAYCGKHVAGAISIPLAELEQRLAKLPKQKEIIAYCRGPYCVLAIEAVKMLRGSGRRARRLEDGVREWSARGFSVSREEEKS